MIRYWYKNPLFGGIALLLIIIFGIVTLRHLPISLLPDLQRPNIVIETTWPGNSAISVMENIITQQEKELRGTPGLYEIESMAYPSFAQVSLSFNYATDLNDAYAYVQQAINRVRDKPVDALPSRIEKRGQTQRMAFVFVQETEPSGAEIDDYQAIIENQILPRLQSVSGISHTKLMLASEEELHIKVDFQKLNQYQVDIKQIVDLIVQNRDLSLGSLSIGKHSYQLTYRGRYPIERLMEKSVASPVSNSLRLSHIVDIERTRSPRRHFVIQNENPAIGIDIYKAKDANMLASLSALYAEIDQLNENVLAKQGLFIEKSFDPTVFIHRAIKLISSNLILGSLLSALILFLFVRQVKLTSSLFLTIPVTLLTVFILLFLMERSLNVISLAAIALATGIILDASIIVMDAIRAQYKTGGKISEAIVKGLDKVYTALLCSASTSVIIFLPLLFLQSFEGQLFEDLALTLTLAIAVSLFVSIFLFPLLLLYFPHWLGKKEATKKSNYLATHLAALTIKVTSKPWFIATTAVVTITGLLYMAPDFDLLPPVKRDVVDNLLIMPKGQDLDMLEQELGTVIKSRLAPHLNQQKQPYIKDYYLAVSPDFTSLGVRPFYREQTSELKQVLQQEILSDIPGLEVITYQAGIFGAMRSSRTVVINLFSADSNLLSQAATFAKKELQQLLPSAGVQSSPSLAGDMPVLSFQPNYEKLAQYGMTEQQLLNIVSIIGDGRFVGMFNDKGRILNVRLKLKNVTDIDQVLALPITTNGILLADLVEVKSSVVLSEVKHVNFQRAQTVMINVPDDMSVEKVSDVAKQVVARLNEEVFTLQGHAQISGANDVLAQALKKLFINLLFSVAVFLLILQLFFRKLKLSFSVLLTLPVAALGGMFTLWLSSLFVPQQLDVLTMIGFLILLGLVINNAILFVDAFIKSQAKTPEQAIEQAFQKRLQPILMTSCTSIIGMLPLALVPGAGNELYRGLGMVLVGGMSIGNMLLMLLLPGVLLLTNKSPNEKILLTPNKKLEA